MKKIKSVALALCFAVTLCALTLFSGGIGNQKILVNAQVEKSYSTNAVISEQGENGFYYAWGLPNKYVLMTYGALVNNGGFGWRGIENYSKISGSGMHPGAYWGALIVWVADESGQVQLSGYAEKSTVSGDGVNIGVYHQEYGGDLTIILNKFIKKDDLQRKFEISQIFTVSKGDSFIFYCDSGNAKNKDSDNVNCPFTITYLETAGDATNNEDLSQYLNVKSAGEVAGFQHIEQTFQSEVLDGSLTEKITKGCASSVSSLTVAPLMLFALPFIRRKRK